MPRDDHRRGQGQQHGGRAPHKGGRPPGARDTRQHDQAPAANADAIVAAGALAPTTRHSLPELPAHTSPSAGFALWSAAAYVRHANGNGDTGYGSIKEESKLTASHFDRICVCRPAAPYAKAFERWKSDGAASGREHRKLVVNERLLVGLAESSLWQTSIDIVAVYGVPRLAGSALKGLAKSFARRLLADSLGDRDLHAGVIDALFGSTRARGAVTFHEAWWVPGSAPARYGKDRPFVREVVTPHHKGAADSNGKTPMTPFDSPTPVPQLAAHGQFLVALEGDRVWVDHAMDILQLGLEMEGAGARTPEYGRGVLQDDRAGRVER